MVVLGPIQPQGNLGHHEADIEVSGQSLTLELERSRARNRQAGR
jgi:hypothetical protein